MHPKSQDLVPWDGDGVVNAHAALAPWDEDGAPSHLTQVITTNCQAGSIL